MLKRSEALRPAMSGNADDDFATIEAAILALYSGIDGVAVSGDGDYALLFGISGSSGSSGSVKMFGY